MKRILLVLIVSALACAPAMSATYFETFSYAQGSNLIGQGGWTGNTGSQIAIDSQGAKLTYSDALKGTFADNSSFAPIGGDMIYWCVEVWSGGTTIGGNAFDIQINDAAGKNFARWYGGAYWEKPRIDSTGYVLGDQMLLADQWNLLCVEVDTIEQTSTFYLNHDLIGSLAYGLAQPGIGNSVAQIRMGFQNATTAQNGAWKKYDNVWLSNVSCVPEPGSMLALLSGLVGIVGFARRRK